MTECDPIQEADDGCPVVVKRLSEFFRWRRVGATTIVLLLLGGVIGWTKSVLLAIVLGLLGWGLAGAIDRLAEMARVREETERRPRPSITVSNDKSGVRLRFDRHEECLPFDAWRSLNLSLLEQFPDWQFLQMGPSRCGDAPDIHFPTDFFPTLFAAFRPNDPANFAIHTTALDHDGNVERLFVGGSKRMMEEFIAVARTVLAPHGLALYSKVWNPSRDTVPMPHTPRNYRATAAA